MRALFATTGSDGDIRPFVALAKGMIARGHQVTFAAADKYQAGVEKHGIRYEVIGPPLTDEEMNDIFSKVLRVSDPLKQLGIVLNSIADAQRQSMPRLLELVSQADVVVYQPLLIAAAAASRAKNAKHVSVQLAPVHAADGYSPLGNLGTFLNRLVWKLAQRMLRGASDDALNTIITSAGIAPWKDVLMKEGPSQWLDLVAVSPHVMPRDPAWPAAAHLSGYLYLDEPEFKVDRRLSDFVGDDKPVVIGFGSMTGFDQRAITQTILDAVKTLNRKVVIQSGWGALGEGASVPSHVHIASFVPHSWLFSRAACIVHHGGAGTTGAAFRAGVPQAIVWHLGDQPVWGKKVHELGVGPKALNHAKLNSKWLRTQIDRMLSDYPMQQRARTLGEEIQKENGVATAIELIEGKLRTDQNRSIAVASGV